MHRTQLLCAIIVSLWSAIAAGAQSTDTTALSGDLRAHVQNDQFQIVTSIRGLPLGVRDALQTLWGSRTLDIVDPGAEFQLTNATRNPSLPIRRLIAAGCSNDHCLLHYERGGTEHTWHVGLFHWTPATTRFEWGGLAPASLPTIDSVRNAILAGTIKTPARVW